MASSDSLTVRRFLSRFPLPSQPLASTLTSLHGISCLSSTAGLRSIRTLADLSHLVGFLDGDRLLGSFGQRGPGGPRSVNIRGGGGEQNIPKTKAKEGNTNRQRQKQQQQQQQQQQQPKQQKKYWSGRASQARTRPLPGCKRRPRADVTQGYPFTDGRSDVKGLLAMGLKDRGWGGGRGREGKETKKGGGGGLRGRL